MNIHAFQMDLVWEDRKANLRKVTGLVQSASLSAGDLVVLPEMCASGFTMNVDIADEGEGRPTEAVLSKLCRQYGVWMVVGLVEKKPDGKGLNQAVVLDANGDRVVIYNKMHPFSLGKEDLYYDRGHTPILFRWHSFQVSPFICYDLRFPEIFRDATFKGAEVICVIANWPRKRVAHWTNLLRSRAIENQCYVVGVNRCGEDPFHSYPGRSMIVDFHGDVLTDAGETEAVVSVSLDRTALQSWRESFPVLKDARFFKA